MYLFKAPAMKLEGNFRIPKSKKPAEEKDDLVAFDNKKDSLFTPAPPPPLPVPPVVNADRPDRERPDRERFDRERVAKSPMKRFKGDCWDKSVDLGPLMKKSRAKEPENYAGMFFSFRYKN